MKMTVTAIRFPSDLLAKLRILAHRESLRGQEITWSALVRRAAERLLKEHRFEEPPVALPQEYEPTTSPAN